MSGKGGTPILARNGERMDERLSETMLADLRAEPLPWVAGGLAVLGQLLIVVGSQHNEGLAIILGLAADLVFVGVWQLRNRYPSLAAWTLTAATLLLLLVGWAWFPDMHVPYLLTLVVIEAAMLLPIAAIPLFALLSAGAILGGYLWWIPITPDATTPIFQVGLIGLIAGLMFLDQHPRKTIVSWAFQGYQDARQHLEAARNRQVELKQALADLALATKETLRLNSLLSAARQAVEEARRTKEEFVANVSHELRTPLNMIIGFSDIILESPEIYAQELPAALLADVAAIKRNSEHLSGLVDDVLNLAELDAGRTQLSLTSVSIQDLAHEAARIVQPFFRQKGLSLSVEVAADLPNIHCDRLRIRQVLLNLLTNAGRFTEHGGATIRVTQGAGVAELRVSDTGPGIAREAQANLFEPFKQADPSIRRRYGGTGLGLALSKRFVELHGGHIWLESEIGRGTTVAFTLPVEPPTAVETVQRWFSPYQEYTARDRPSAAPAPATRPSVVIVEQGETLGAFVKRYVEELEPHSVESLEEAQTAVELYSATALLIDEAGLSADDALQTWLPQLSFDIPVVRCRVPRPHPRWANLHIEEYLVKPIPKDRLLKTLSRLGPGAQTVLLADDDFEARQLFGRMLASADEDYRVLYAMDGAITLEMLRERQPDVVLLDLVMPNVDGFAVLEEMSRDETIRDIPVIIISALDRDRDPIVSRELVVSRQNGLSARELMLALHALTQALPPRFGAPKRPADPFGSTASG